MTIVRLAGLREPQQATALQAQVAAIPGVTACTITADGQGAVVSYHPDEVSDATVRQTLTANGRFQVTKPHIAAATGPPAPQCPVPATWVVALERIRFALNFRRFFVQA